MWISLVKIIPGLIALFSLIWRTFVSAKDRALGREEATADALRKQAEENAKAVKASDDAEEEHTMHPHDDDGFDKRFMRPE